MDLPEIATFAAALLAVLALIMAIAWVLRRFFGGTQRPGQSPLRRRDRRLGVVEAAQVGPRHRLLLVRRDDREHLLLIGGTTELLIETDIPHDGGESEVSIRSVEPRLRDEPKREEIYRPSDDFEPRTSRAPPGGTGFGSTFTDRFDEPDERADSGPRFDLGDRDRDGPFTDRQGFNRNDDYEEEDRPSYPRADAPSYQFDDSSRDRESGSSVFERDRSSSENRHVIDDEGDNNRGDDDRYAPTLSGLGRAEDDDPAQSRILSRFLKKDDT